MAKCSFAGMPVLLVKPQTFMNLSGDSVAPVVKYHNAAPSDLVVVQDDIDLAAGRIRIRKGGSSGGHNGIKSVIERLGSQDFIRLKLGVGKDRTDVVGHVLGKFSPEMRRLMDLEVAASVKAAESVLRFGPDQAMNEFNGWSADGGAQ
jgi:PTH1 family peptidyl-tRNA hydrolase